MILTYYTCHTQTCHIHHKRGVPEVCHPSTLLVSHDKCAMPGSPMGRLLGLTDGVQTTLHVDPSHMSDRVALDGQSMHNECMYDPNTHEPFFETYASPFGPLTTCF